MKKQDKYLDKLLIKGLVDIRKQAVVGNAKKLPNGEYGFCLLCLKQNYLHIYDTDFNQNIGELLYEIDLKSVFKFKASSFIFNSYIKFVYEGYKYKICDFAGCKEFIQSIKSELEDD